MIIEEYKYTCRLDLHMLSDSSSQQLLELAADSHDLAVKTLLSGDLPYYGIGVAPDSETSESDTQDSYNRLVNSNRWLGAGRFVMHAIPTELNQLLIDQLPDIIKVLFPEPYIRLQTLENFQIPPHEDARSITIMVPLTTSKIQTVFYDYIKPHPLFRSVTADPDLIHEVHRTVFCKHETWLLDTKSVHATQGIELEPRVTVNYNWTGISYQEFLHKLTQ